jgi:TolC family type I secretion outer membrane protein
MKTAVRILFAASLAAAARADTAQDSPPDPLDLPAAIRYALDHNYAILQAREQIRQQEGVILQARGPEIPNLTGSASYQRNDQTISEFYPPSTSNWTAELKVTQTVFAGGGIVASVRNARLNRDAALEDLQTTVDTALLGVRTAFDNVLLAREQVRVQEENVELYRSQLRDTQNQFRTGSVSNFEVLRAKVSLANAQPDLITARNNLRIAIEQLRQALGAPSGRSAEVPPFPDVRGSLDIRPESVDLDSALASAHEHRPELLRLEKLEDAGEAAVTAAKSNYYPSVGAFGAYQWGGFGFAQGSSLSANGWLFGVQSTWNIFDGRATAGKVVQARSQLRQQKLSRSEEELAIDVEVHQAISGLQEAAELVDASKETVGQAEEALREANSRYKAGNATQLDVLTSQVSLTQARTNQLEANYNYLVAEATLRKAMGLGDALVAP